MIRTNHDLAFALHLSFNCQDVEGRENGLVLPPSETRMLVPFSFLLCCLSEFNDTHTR